MSKSYSQQMKDELVGPKDHMLIVQHGGLAAMKYVGPCTKAHAEYVAQSLKRDEEMRLTVYPTSDPSYIPLQVTIIQLDRPPQAGDVRSKEKYDLYFKYCDIFLARFKKEFNKEQT